MRCPRIGRGLVGNSSGWFAECSGRLEPPVWIASLWSPGLPPHSVVRPALSRQLLDLKRLVFILVLAVPIIDEYQPLASREIGPKRVIFLETQKIVAGAVLNLQQQADGLAL